MRIKTNIQAQLFLVLVVFFTFIEDGLSQQKITMTPAEEDLQVYINQYKKLQKKQRQKTSEDQLTMPLGVNPFTSYHSDRGSVKEWSHYFYKMAEARKKHSGSKRIKMNPILEEEGENQNTNGTQESAQNISTFGNGSDQNNRVAIEGRLTANELPEFSIDSISIDEDNGSIPLATVLDFSDNFQSISAKATFGDGPHGSTGSGSGDIDFFEISLKENELIEFSASAAASSSVIPVVIIYNELGEILDFSTQRVTSFSIDFLAPEDGKYYFGLYDLDTLIKLAAMIRPFDSASGQGVGEEGDYAIDVKFIGITESDFYSFQLEKGDVFGVAVDARFNSTARLFFPDGKQAIGTNRFGNFFSEESPLASLSGQTIISYIAPEKGKYTISIGGSFGAYRAEMLVSRPGLEINKGNKQIIYLDFTGAEFNQREFFNIPDSVAVGDSELDKERFLSPFGDFLENWGIENTRVNRLRFAIKNTNIVKENLQQDFIDSGLNPNFDVEIISDFGSELLGKRIPQFLDLIGVPYSRVIIGGTIEESGIRTIGIANNIDPGNYSLADDSLVLLDVLGRIINDIPVAEGFTVRDVMPVVVGNVITHEIGHYLGNFHSSRLNDVFSIMDEGGSILSIAGMLPETAFGDGTTVDVDFARDVYSEREGFTGIDLTDVNTAYALSYFPNYDKSSKELPLEEIRALEANVLNELYKKAPATVYSYPNPQNVDEISHLIFSTEEEGNVNVSLYDLTGRKISVLYNGDIQIGEKKEITLNPSMYGLTSGIYMYTVKTRTTEKSYRIAIK